MHAVGTAGASGAGRSGTLAHRVRTVRACPSLVLPRSDAGSWCATARPCRGRGAPRPWSGSTRRPWPSPPRWSGRLHRAWSARQPVVVALAVDPGSFRSRCDLGRRAVDAGAVVRAVDGPAALPRLGQHLRRPRRRTGVVVGPQGRAAGRRRDPGRPGRRRAGRWPAGVGRRRSAGAARGRRRRGRRARRLGRARAPGARPRRTWPRPPTSLPTSSPPSPTAPARRG